MKLKKPEIQHNELSKETKVSMKTRIISAIIGLIIVVPLLIIGDWFFLALIFAITVIGLYEAVRCGKGTFSVWLYIVTIIIGVLMVNWPIFRGLINDLSYGHAYNYFTSMDISLVLVFAGVCLLFLVVIVHPSFTVKDGFFIIAMVIIISMGFQAVLFTRFFPSYINATPREGWFNSFDNFASCSFLVYGLIGTFMTDIGAYFIGVFFGKHKLNERISPKKTVEGFFGGIIISALASMAFAFILSLNGASILEGIYDLDHWYNILFMSLFMPFLATLGDFVFSAVKRAYEIKDFGTIMPGHGGILDRADSILFVFTGLALYTLLYFGLANGGGLLI